MIGRGVGVCAGTVLTFGPALELGSAGTQAGLVVGLVGNNSNLPLTGINVSRSRQEQEPKVHKLAAETAAILGVEGGVPREAVTSP